ncbi:MAG: hypothetical protein ACI841_004640, partial [Planctomycetota bacterium]
DIEADASCEFCFELAHGGYYFLTHGSYVRDHVVPDLGQICDRICGRIGDRICGRICGQIYGRICGLTR